MKKEKVSFIATKFKNQKVNINFYTKEGKKINFDAVKKKPTHERVEFYATKK